MSGDVGKTLRVVVTAKNTAGSASATSEPTSLVAALLPSNTGLPTISGLLQVGQIMDVSTGSWTGTTPIEYSYQWQKCELLAKGCVNIAEAIHETLELKLTWLGFGFRVIVTAKNAAGSTSASSEETGLLESLL